MNYTITYHNWIWNLPKPRIRWIIIQRSKFTYGEFGSDPYSVCLFPSFNFNASLQKDLTIRMHSKWTFSLHPPSNPAKPMMCDNSHAFNYEWLQTVTSWQLPADEMSGNITLLYYRLLQQLIRASSIHAPGEWYYIPPFYLNNINRPLQSPLYHCFLNKDILFLLTPVNCWLQLDPLAEE